MTPPACGDRNRRDPDWPKDPPRVAHGCGSRLHAIQYRAIKITHLSDTTVKYSEAPEVCLVCPRCDSVGAR